MADLVCKHYQSLKSECLFDFSLKEEQIFILNRVCNGNDVFVCLTTGFGKTICMVLPPLLLDKVNY